MYERLVTVGEKWDKYRGQAVTVRCRVVGEPKVGRNKGKKTVYRVTDPLDSSRNEYLLSFWHEQPEEPFADPLEKTADRVLSLIDPEKDGSHLSKGEDILVRGIPYDIGEERFINVTSIILRHPDLEIGKGQMRLPQECERLIYLLFTKNVYRPHDSFANGEQTKWQFAGDIAHKALEYGFTKTPYSEYFAKGGWEPDDVDSLIAEVLHEEFLVSQALHSLRGTGKNDAVEIASEALKTLVQSESLLAKIQAAEEIETERAVAQAYGFDGRVDLLLDGVPYDLKTGSTVKSRDRFQMKLYLLSLLLEKLSVGADFEEVLASDHSGYLIYTGSDDTIQQVEVTLNGDAVDDILQLRNKIATVRNGFGVPSPYGQDCEGCVLRDGRQLDGLDSEHGTLPSPCKFHCQAERRWPCYHIGEDDIETRCPLFEECEQRLEYHNPEITDHYNELRTALKSEKRVRQDATDAFAALPDDTLAEAGLLITDLTIESILSDRRISYSSESDAIGFTAGDSVRVSRTDGTTEWAATYLGRQDGTHVIEFDEQLGYIATIQDETYTARRTPHSHTLPRKYIRQLDFAQRIGVDPRLGETDDISSDPEPDTIDRDDLSSYLPYRELFIDIPVQPDRDQQIGNIVADLCRATLPQFDSDESVPYGEKRTLVLCTRNPQMDALHDELGSLSEYVRFDPGATGEHTYPDGRDQHEIKEALKSSEVILSSFDYAVDSEVFHYMMSGDTEHRPHSNKYFDTLLIVGADLVTEPEYYYLQKLADRTISIGDAERSHIDMLSEAANASGLAEAYFKKAFERYRVVDSSTANSVRFTGAASEQAIQMLDTERLESTQGQIRFIDSDSSESLSEQETTFESSLESGESPPRRIEFELTDPTSDILDVEAIFGEQNELPIDTIETGEVYVVNETRLRCRTVDSLENEQATSHRVLVHVPLSRSLFFTKQLLSNPTEAELVADLAEQEHPDRIVTPFAGQATRIRAALADADLEIPVLLPRQLDGTTVQSTIVSMAVGNSNREIHPPAASYETLYLLLTSGQEVTLVGDADTLSANRLFRNFIGDRT